MKHIRLLAILTATLGFAANAHSSNSMNDTPESLPHGVVPLDYRVETDSFDFFKFSQYILLPVGHSGTASIPTVDLPALPGFPRWGMFDYNGDQLEGWQYGYSAALSGSFEQDTAALYRNSQPE